MDLSDPQETDGPEESWERQYRAGTQLEYPDFDEYDDEYEYRREQWMN